MQAAVDVLPNGGLIFVRLAEYPLTATVTIATDDLIIQAEGSGTIFTHPAAGNSMTLFTITGDRVCFRDFYIDGNKADLVSVAGTGLITISGSWDSVLENIHIHDGKNAAVTLTAIATRNRIFNCEMLDCSEYGVCIVGNSIETKITLSLIHI